jgi:carbon storage regulator
MLVLTRKTGQKLIIANDIEVTVLEIRGDSVKIGIQAPKHITIYREEIFEEIRNANQQSGSTGKLPSSGLELAAQAVAKLKPLSGAPAPLKPTLILPEQQ